MSVFIYCRVIRRRRESAEKVAENETKIVSRGRRGEKKDEEEEKKKDA